MVDYHTQGEWLWSEDPTSPGYFPIKSASGVNICMMQERNSDCGMDTDPERTETIANARLVCAAPKLLHELETARSILVELEGWGPETENIKSIDAAIKAARLVVL